MIELEKAGEIVSLKERKADIDKLYVAMKSYIENPESV